MSMSKLVTILSPLIWRSLETAIESYKNTPKEPEKPVEESKIDEIIAEEPKILQKTTVLAEITSKLPVNGPRIIRLSETLYFCRNLKATTFCNKEDFKGEWYTNGTNSPYPRVHRDRMQGLLGISLPYPIKSTRKTSIVNPKTGLIHTYDQVDVGPGWTDDNFWEKGTDPKNEKGFDYLGNKSVKASIDFFPQVWEDLGLLKFQEAYDGSPSGYFDVLIHEAKKGTVTKTKGNEVPSKDSRLWVGSLPDLRTEFFSWRELLRGWNSTEKPDLKIIKNLVLLTEKILIPARTALGRLRVGSGLRDLETNERVGGREGSFHLTGRAIDLTPLDVSFKDLHEWLTKNISHDLLRENVWEFPNKNNEHVHVAVKLDPKENTNIRIKE